MASSADDGDDSVDELQSFQELSPVKSADAPSVTALQHRPRMSSPVNVDHEMGEDEKADSASEDSREDDGDFSFQIQLPPPINTEQYTYISGGSEDGYVDCVESEVEDSENVSYHIRYDDGGDDIVSVFIYICTTSPTNGTRLTYLSSTTFIHSIQHHQPPIVQSQRV
jgi:hypothetical protein